MATTLCNFDKNLIHMRTIRNLIVLYTLLLSGHLYAQNFIFYSSNGVKFMKNSTDSLKNPFTGGFNSPQFSNMDLDGNGTQDLFVFDRTSAKVTTFINSNGGMLHTPYIDGRFPRLNSWVLLRDFDADGKIDIFTEVTQDLSQLPDKRPDARMPFVSGLRILRNVTPTNGNLTFRQINNQVYDTGGVWIDFGGVELAPSAVIVNNSDIPAIADIDNDGDVDILSFTATGLSPTYYENYLKNKSGTQYQADSSRFIKRDECWGYMQYDAGSPLNIFRLHQSFNQIPTCAFQMYGKRKHAGTTLTMLDYNHDGVLDLIYSDIGYKNLILLTNSKNSLGRDSIVSQDTLFPSNTIQANFIDFPASYYVDFNGNGKKELLVTTNEPNAAKSVNNVWMYENTGTNDKPVFDYVGNNTWLYNETVDLGTRSAPTLVDIDGDGDLDLVVATSGDFETNMNIRDKLVLYKNTPEAITGRSVFTLSDTNFLNISSSNLMINTIPTFADLNGDGKPDLIIGMESGELLFFENTSDSTNISFELTTGVLDNIDVGVSSAPAFADLDNDGDLDLVVGNRNGILKYYENTGTATAMDFAAQPTIDSFGYVSVRRCFNTIFGEENCEPTGFAVPTFFDINGDSSLELVVGSQSGSVFIYSNISVAPGARFTKHENVFVDYSNGLNATNKHHGLRAVACVGKLDGDDVPDMLIGNLAGGLAFFNTTPQNGTGINKFKVNQTLFEVYPNPAKHELHIRLLQTLSGTTYEIYDITGKLQLKGKIQQQNNESSVSINELSSGVYFIKLQDNSGKQSVQKFMVR
jgi:hypothetical protein